MSALCARGLLAVRQLRLELRDLGVDLLLAVLALAVEELLQTSVAQARSAVTAIYLLDTADLPAGNPQHPYRGALTLTERPGSEPLQGPDGDTDV